MKYISEFRDRDIIERLAKAIHLQASGLTHEMKIMEVCGTHTMAIGRYAIRSMLPSSIKLISGPGCPVCVTPRSYLDSAIELSKLPGLSVATFGDMLKVPGSFSSLEKERAAGRNIRVVYSPFECLDLAMEDPARDTLFLSVGFETTAPVAAAALREAELRGIRNLYFYSGHKLLLPAMEALLQSGEAKIDAFICPGHVSAVTGTAVYEDIVGKYNIPCVVSGFEPVDILQSILALVEILTGKKNPSVINQYRRVARRSGNRKAQDAMSAVFEVSDSNWRGLGAIPESGLSLRKEYGRYDALKRFPLKLKEKPEEKGCICGEILKGVRTPRDCILFGRQCTPGNPVGPCMVSSEGTCAAFYRYGG